MSSKSPQVALFGVHWLDPMVPDHAKAGLKHKLEDVAAKCRSEAGANLVFASEPGQDIEAVRKTLASQHWDAVIIGFGMRSIPGLTIFFEQVVNAVHELAPQARFLFNTSIEDSLDAVKRLQSSP